MLINNRCLSIALLLTTAGALLLAQVSLPPGAKFEIVSVKALSSTEAAQRSPHTIAPNNLVVRLRLTCAKMGFYFYTWGDSVIPVGYKVKFTDAGPVWLNKMPGQTQQGTSPGTAKLNSFVPGVWRLMSGHDRSAIEWDELDSTSFKGEKHGFTVFIKLNETDAPIEIVSDPYVVPADEK